MTSPHSPLDDTLIDTYRTRLQSNLDSVRERVTHAGGSDVVVLPVSKAQPVEAVAAAQQLGLSALGENYAQEQVAKATHPDIDATPVDWHFIGQLQRNRVKSVAPFVTLWQSVDRVRVARAIALHAPGARVLAQVNLADDQSKAGCTFDELDALLDEIRAFGLDLVGLMGVGTADDERATAQAFGRLRRAVDDHGLAICSMGMTADLELAIAEGSTMVRIGTALFGARP